MKQKDFLTKAAKVLPISLGLLRCGYIKLDFKNNAASFMQFVFVKRYEMKLN